MRFIESGLMSSLGGMKVSVRFTKTFQFDEDQNLGNDGLRLKVIGGSRWVER